MAAEEVYQKILEHLKKDGPLNTFRLATNLDIDRSKLLDSIEKLEKAGAVEVQHGVVKFLKFVTEEKKVEKLAEATKTISKPKKKIKKVKKKPIVPQIRTENKELKEKILQLESKVEELEKKASAPPKIIKKTIVKEVPAHSVSASTPYSHRKRSKEKKIKEVKKKPKRSEEKKKSKKANKISKKFKFPKFTFMKNIKQLKKPEFAKK